MTILRGSCTALLAIQVILFKKNLKAQGQYWPYGRPPLVSHYILLVLFFKFVTFFLNFLPCNNWMNNGCLFSSATFNMIKYQDIIFLLKQGVSFRKQRISFHFHSKDLLRYQKKPPIKAKKAKEIYIGCQSFLFYFICLNAKYFPIPHSP